MYVSGDNLQPIGNVYGSPSLSRTSGTTPVIILHEDPGRLGVIRLVLSFFFGNTGVIDMSYVQMQWNREAGRENISRTTTAMLVCPNWTVSNKFNLLPGRTADSDDWLEPNEQFELTLCPQEGVPPYRTFAIVFSPDGVAVPLSTTRTFPFNIQPAMNLG